MKSWQSLLTLSFFFSVATSNLLGQEPAVQNVEFTQLKDSRVEVTYDLLADPSKKYEVKLRLAQSGSRRILRVSREALSGYVGEGISPGRGLRIIWNLPKDYPQGLEGESFVFVVEVYERGGGGSKLPWILGGVAAGGIGVAVVYLLSGSTPPPTTGSIIIDVPDNN